MPSSNPPPIASPSPQRRVGVVKPPSSPRRHLYHHRNNQLQAGSPASGALSPNNRRRKDVGEYWLGKTLGKGSSGRVKLGIHKVSGEKVAIKIISKSHLAANASVEHAVKREIAVMKLIHHPNIMRLLDVIDLSDSPNLYLILEFVQGGELFEHLVSKGRLSEPEARKYFQQIIFGLDYCHRHLICHRDLKPENLLLDKDKNIKIADFGMASLQPTGSLLETSCGSPHYASPEIVTGIPYNGAASDIWSCGIILYALLCGHLPFDDDNIRELLNKVKVGKYKMPDHISDGARDLIRRILVVHPGKRLTMKEVQDHPWFMADPPENPSILPDPPTASEIGRPVANASEIDDRLLETLKVLWTDVSTEQLTEALLNDEYNMQKVTYVLLQRHAANYWKIDRDEEMPDAGKAKRRRRPATICAVASSTKDAMPGLDGMLKKITDQTRKANIMSPAIQHHTMQTQQQSKQGISRLEPVASETGSPDAVPPPVPPKPIVIRADQAPNDSRYSLQLQPHYQQTPPQPPSPAPPPKTPQRQHHAFPPPQLCPPTSCDYWRQSHPGVTGSPAPARPFRRFGGLPEYLEQAHQQQQHLQAYSQHHYYHPHPMHLQPSGQHTHIGHMLSPRAPPSGRFQPPPVYYHPPYYAQPIMQPELSPSPQPPLPAIPPYHHYLQPVHPPSSPDPRLMRHARHAPPSTPSSSSSSAASSSSKFNRLIHLWQRNRVEPTVKSHKASHRLSMPTPQTQLEFDRMQRSSVISPVPAAAPEQSHPPPPHSPFVRHQSGMLSPSVSRPAGSPRLSSWLPGLFHFKQPKVCSIDCIARDEHEAVGKITQVLEECMEGSILERRDSEGVIRRKGEMVLPGSEQTKSILLRFKLEVQTPQQYQPHKLRTVRVSFVQQQGDAVALMTAVRMVERTLEMYEQESTLITTANGWTPQPSYHQ
ncbi:hypothetical protein BCR43DRAFT_474942 [Syncephalastrum racemosum]|uniref:non-specific serine/threonine protein kinase n=1 Tax=Syncephalastrum racemosum TaxID=13706 RepID=A0A1X2HDT7_SYNRA|nr:hypothetical protein BCR43DRAFT_474942 [Syncephalastrum racemosum]